MRSVNVFLSVLAAAAVLACHGCGKIGGPNFPLIPSPRVIVATPAGPASADITISFQLIDRELESADVTLQYSTDGARTFATATLTNPPDAINLTSDWHPGVTHTLQWDSVTDMVGRSGEVDVLVKITPSDATNPGGNPGLSGTFTVNNLAYNEPPGATVAAPAGVQSGDIQVSYFLADAESDTCSITAEYSTNGGTTYQAATMGPGGDGATGLSSSPSGTQHVFVWDSCADNVALAAQQDNIRIRITPADFNDGTAGEAPSLSVDNRIAADFSASPTSGEAPLLVSFTDLSRATSGITSWLWDFGDGATSSAQNPSHTYGSAGSYTVTLMVNGPDGSDAETKISYITVTTPGGNTIYVNDASGNDLSDGLSWGTAVKTIQTGLNKAGASGWTVLVANGTYTGTGNKDLDFNGKGIHLKSAGGAANCIIDCEGSGRGFHFHNGETNAAVVEGFTIRNGNISDDCGGGIYCWESAPTITNCTIVNNHANSNGGGIFCYNCSPNITNCTINNNSAPNRGGGMYCTGGACPTITNCTIANNSGGWGGGICCFYFSNPTITNCTIVYNTATHGGGICCWTSVSAILNNTIIWGNNASFAGKQIRAYENSGFTITLRYCDYADSSLDPKNAPGEPLLTEEGVCIHLDPLFVNATAQDYHLQETSPCIDAGNNSYISGVTTDLDGNTRIAGGTVDIGAYEYQASLPGPDADELEIFNIVNQERSAAGVSPLAWCDGLFNCANAHACDMCDRGFFSHTNPEGEDPSTRAELGHAGSYTFDSIVPDPYAWIGENIAWGQQTPAVVMDAWMNSPGHRANILMDTYTHIGVGVCNCSTRHWVQCFGTR